jgi:hypothetical protein
VGCFTNEEVEDIQMDGNGGGLYCMDNIYYITKQKRYDKCWIRVNSFSRTKSHRETLHH